MAFPFNYKGKIRCETNLCPDTEWFQREFLRRAKERFEIAKADIVVQENEISFRTTAKAFPYWFNKDAASLANVTKGILFLMQINEQLIMS